MASVFGGIEKAEVFGGGVKIRAGRHRVRIEELLVHKSRKSAKFFFIVEASVLASEGGRPTTARELPAGQSAPRSEPHAIGERITWLVDLSQASGLANVKGFALALAPDAKDSDVTEAGMLALVNQDPAAGLVQPAAGLEVEADAIVILTDKKGEDFTRVRWSFPAN